MKKPTCPICGSNQTYYRRKTGDFACKSCPNTFRKDSPLKSPQETPQTHSMHPNVKHENTKKYATIKRLNNQPSKEVLETYQTSNDTLRIG